MTFIPGAKSSLISPSNTPSETATFKLICVQSNYLQAEESLQKAWVLCQDEVMVRSTKCSPTTHSEDLDSTSRHHFHITDPITGPNQPKFGIRSSTCSPSLDLGILLAEVEATKCQSKISLHA
ncbi:hypothetical protein TSMEX_003210 [Taenia solium]|eukprot:TsM_001008800 transcript=TsM_001008800 gene=TsM_001008800